MAQQIFYRPFELPVTGVKGTTDTLYTTLLPLNATGEEVHFIGHVMLENPNGAAKTISAAGGGKIHWLPGTTTFADAATQLDIGIQDVSTATAPAQGDGTFDVSATLIGGTDTITSSTYLTTTMESGSKALSQGQLVSIAFKMTARGGVDSVVVSAASADNAVGGRTNRVAVMDKTAGVFAANAAVTALAGIEFDDGTVGWLIGSEVKSALGTTAINSGTATADEYGNLIRLPFPATVLGAYVMLALAGTSSDFEVILYEDPLGSPVVLATAVVDATQVGSVTAGRLEVAFSTPVVIEAGTAYAVTVRPTTANNVTLSYYDVGNVKFNKLNGLGDNCYAVRRLDNAGAFSDTNGGTAKTRTYKMGMLLAGISDGLDGGGSVYVQS